MGPGTSDNRFKTGSVVAAIRAAAYQLIFSKAVFSSVHIFFLLYKYRYRLTEHQSFD